jgi:hypothetical protein
LTGFLHGSPGDCDFAAIGSVFDGIADHMIKDFIKLAFIGAGLGQVR